MNELTNPRLERFVTLLKGIFELDKSDLDFGIYRIMNIRKDKIENFLSQDLPRKVRDTLAPFAHDSSLDCRITQIEKQCADLGIPVSASPKLSEEYNALKKQQSEEKDMTALENDVYSALYSFFNRYYDEGDFISKRRYKEGVYAIPYEGEEVKLYWANQDQYYIKTSENFKDYTFIEQDLTTHFRLMDATSEQNNNKESDESKRVFMLYTEQEDLPDIHTFDYNQDKKELIIRFIFDIPEDKKRRYAEENYTAIVDYIVKHHPHLVPILMRPASKDPKKPKDLLRKHLDAYVAKNTFDYFIHKDLGSFLRRELDFYIKSEIIRLDDLDTDSETKVESWLAVTRAVKRIGNTIIDFLAQIEDFQKKLWLKKKFITETNYCLTLDNIPEYFWQEIIRNKTQIQEWIDMYAIDEVKPSLAQIGWTNPPSMDFLRQNKNLLIDTKHFSPVFRDKLIASIDNLDEKVNGILINADNFHGLNLLQKKYAEKINCIYIDPPYNTDASKILYKNNYEHSSWLTMMYDRIIFGRKLLKVNGIQATTIDEYELQGLYALKQNIFGRVNNAGILAIRINPSGRPRDGGFALSHEYALVFKNSEEATIDKINRSEEQNKRYDKIDEYGCYEQRNFRREGSNSDRADGIRQWYPFYVDENNLSLRIPKLKWNTKTELWDILEEKKVNEVEIWPITDSGTEKNWRWAWQNVIENYDQFYAIKQKSGIQIYYKFRPNEEGISALTFWDDKRYSATENGTKLLKTILPGNQFSYPKSIFAVEDLLSIIGLKNEIGITLDFFAGSGTTGHAVINLNRQDHGNRKYILVEMGEYFNTVTKPRMQKVIYSADWKDGKPQSRNSGVSQIIKYFRLESYEDVLSNISLDTQKGDSLLSLFGSDYLIKYMLDIETSGSLLNLDAFTNPFEYQMKITENNEAKLRPVDIVETFNYLIGITVQRQGSKEYYRTMPDPNGEYEGSVTLIRDDAGEFGFQQIEGILPDGNKTLIVWRTITENLILSNAALDAYFRHYCLNPLDREYEIIFINGDSNLENIRRDDEQWKVIRTETEFKARMFEEK